MKTTLVIPTLNEKASIIQVLAEVPDGAVDEIIVVDGGSTDGTARLASEAGARVLLEPRRGYGRACFSGLQAAKGDLVVFMDADGADDPAQIPLLLAPLVEGSADLVLGSRLSGDIQKDAMPWHQRAGNRLAAGLLRLLYGVHITDLAPFRAVWREKLLTLDLREMTYGLPTEVIVKAAKRNWRIREVPIDYRARIGGRSKISGTLRGTLLAGYHILRVIFSGLLSQPNE